MASLLDTQCHAKRLAVHTDLAITITMIHTYTMHTYIGILNVRLKIDGEAIARVTGNNAQCISVDGFIMTDSVE